MMFYTAFASGTSLLSVFVLLCSLLCLVIVFQPLTPLIYVRFKKMAENQSSRKSINFKDSLKKVPKASIDDILGDKKVKTPSFHFYIFRHFFFVLERRTGERRRRYRCRVYGCSLVVQYL